ncbi:MAG: hypothetical protein NC302_12270 [Bacteroidales bacterium]|nr:hypothetical protein [Bacteroidales bacterium]
MIKTCPGCGAGLPERLPPVCPYCGRELIDLGRQHTDQKIAEVKRTHAETAAVPKKIGRIVAVTLFVLFLLLMLIFLLNIPEKVSKTSAEREVNRLSRDMRKAYESEDWDLLERYLITECEDYIGAPDYFMYRTAWYLHAFPALFDEAETAGDKAQMLRIYEIFAEDYDMRGDETFYRIYETDDAIEEALKEEVERETEILTEEGLTDEMYKLRR